MTRRGRVIDALARAVCAEHLGHPVRVAIDGVTASGKSTLARELAAAVAGLGRPAIHLTMDGFHHPRARRYRRGRLSAEGYYNDAYDFAGLAEQVLIPLGPDGSRRYRTSIIDLASDQPVVQEPVEAAADALLIVDGTFLQRPEIVDLWDHRIFVDARLSVARERGTRRDAAQLGGLAKAEQLYDSRYHAAARLYLAAVDPGHRATLVIDNNDFANPELRPRSTFQT
jgi:uridine kinase